MRIVRTFNIRGMTAWQAALSAPNVTSSRKPLHRGPTWLDDRGTRQWRWMEEVRCRTSLAPLASPCFIVSLLSLETEGLLTFQGRSGITSIVRWNLRPVIFGVDYRTPWPTESQNQDDGKGGWVQGGGVAETAETVKTVKPSRSSLGTVFCRTSKRRARCPPEPPKPSKPPTPSWRLPPLNSTHIFRHPDKPPQQQQQQQQKPKTLGSLRIP